MQNLFVQTLLYVVDAPYFWQSMGMTTAISMFIGALIYDGQLTEVKKGIVSVFSYAIMLLWMTLSRITDVIERNPANLTRLTFAGTISVIFVSLAWILGVFLGVMIFYKKYKGKSVL